LQTDADPRGRKEIEKKKVDASGMNVTGKVTEMITRSHLGARLAIEVGAAAYTSRGDKMNLSMPQNVCSLRPPAAVLHFANIKRCKFRPPLSFLFLSPSLSLSRSVNPPP